MTLSKKYVKRYSHRNSLRTFIQARLLTLFVLRAYLKTTCRGVIEIVELSDALQQKMGLTKLPNYSTLKKFSDCSSVLEIIDAMLLEMVQLFATHDTESAVDSTGFETISASAYFQSKTGRK